jgi:hypothetical protein
MTKKQARPLAAKAPKFTCPECEEVFDSARILGAHRRSKHGVLGSAPSTIYARNKKKEAEKSAAEHPYKCPECPASFPLAVSLGTHRRSKHGVLGRTHLKDQPKPQKEPTPDAAISTETLPAVPTPRRYKPRQNAEVQPPAHEEGISDVTLTVAYGRFLEFQNGLAREYDLPAGKFARALNGLIYRSAIR